MPDRSIFQLTFLLNFEHVRPLHRVRPLSEVRLVLRSTRKDCDNDEFMKSLVILIVIHVICSQRLIRIIIIFGDVGKLWLWLWLLVLLNKLLQNIINLHVLWVLWRLILCAELVSIKAHRLL